MTNENISAGWPLLSILIAFGTIIVFCFLLALILLCLEKFDIFCSKFCNNRRNYTEL